MKAIDKLIELRKEDTSIVAIAMDESQIIYGYREEIPIKKESIWSNNFPYFQIKDLLEFDSKNWQKCIATLNDIESYEVKMISISVQQYERLLESEKKLKEIQKFFV